jgi:methylenetetrahydrofolate dehydrogenase (NADP+)/methenyltetrahydrofolate cyclohydrolase
MTATILDGRRIADRIRQELQREAATLHPRPSLRVLYFDTNVSRLYWLVQQQTAAALEIDVGGQGSKSECLPSHATQQQVDEVIRRWNDDPKVHGIFVHQPLPRDVDPQRVSAMIDPRKDVEGIHPQNSARRFFARARIGSCTALAVMRLIEETEEPLEGKEAVVVGHSEIVGRPVSMLLLDKLATTTVCHIGTRNLEDHVRRADLLVVAVGKPHVIKGTWIKPGSTVIDVGINVVNGRVVGDVESDEAKARAKFLSPVPGGVGPVTVMMVMKNTIEAFKLQHP